MCFDWDIHTGCATITERHRPFFSPIVAYPVCLETKSCGGTESRGIAWDDLLGFENHRHGVNSVDLIVRIVEGIHQDQSAQWGEIGVGIVDLNHDFTILTAESVRGEVG